MHVRFQDLIIRGGGLNTVFLQFGVNLDFDRVFVYGGTYCLRARGTGPMRFTNSALYGGIPPWAFRSENGLHTYSPDYYDPFLREFADPPPNVRNIARLPTHAVLVTEGSFEFEVFYYPHNHDWEIANSEFADSHDGIYLSGKTIRFHHNWLDNAQDDGIYLSAPTPHFSDNLHVYQNVITRCLMAFGCHSRGGPKGNTYVYRNVADLREGVNSQRPTPAAPQGVLTNYHIYLMHGRDFLGVESQHFYQNTLICQAYPDAYAHRMLYNTSKETQRRVFNNILVYLNEYRGLRTKGMEDRDIQCDGNVHWCSTPGAQPPAGLLDKVRNDPASEQAKKKYPPGWEANSVVADPRFVRFGPAPTAENDYRLQPDSPAAGGGVPLPDDLVDPLRPAAGVRPDAGAIPLGAEPLRAGIDGRVTAGGRPPRGPGFTTNEGKAP
jgi:hypothetical protein